MMMEVQQRLACLSPTQRLPAHPAASALRTLQTPPPSRLHGKTMIVEVNHASPASPPNSPPQGEILPKGASEAVHEMSAHRSAEKESGGLRRKFQNEAGAEAAPHPVWGPGPDSVINNGVEEFSQAGMAREGLEEGSASPGQHSPRQLEDHVPDHFRGEGMEDCYTPPASRAPHTPISGQEIGRRRRKPGLEDIVRRRRSELETNPYSMEPMGHEDRAGESGHHHPEGAEDLPMTPEDEVDGGAPQGVTREEIKRELQYAQACAESAIKQSMQQSGFENMDRDMDEDEEEPEGEDPYHQFSPPGNYFVRPRPEDDYDEEEEEDRYGGSPDFHRPGGPWDPRSGLTPPYLDERRRDDATAGHRDSVDKKPEVTILPKSHHLHGGLPHGPHPLSSESAYSPHHHLGSPKLNGWFPGMPHLFPPFGHGMMDGSGMGHKFLPFHEGKIITEIDKDYLKCNYCERTFRRQKNLENHIESTHQKGSPEQRPKRENGDMYFKCSHCPYTTKHQSNLYVHLRIHTGERPYICGACGVQYSQSHSLKSHIINKHEGHMNFYIKEKRNRSPRGLGYLSTHMLPGDHGAIFKIPPPPNLQSMPPSLQQSNMEIVQRAIEMARNSLNGDMPGPPPLMHLPPASSRPPHSPLMSPNGSSHPHSLFSKPGFPFNGHFPGMGLPFPDLPANPAAAMMNRPQHSPASRNGLPGGVPGLMSPGSHAARNELMHLAGVSGVGPTPGSAPGFHAVPPPHTLMSPASGKAGMPSSSSSCSPNSQHPSSVPAGTPNGGSPAGAAAPAAKTAGGKGSADCGAMDLTTKGGPAAGGRKPGDCASCVNCSHGNKLKLLRLNVVRMLSILVPNLNFEEKGISADSDSVDELLQDVIESNTQDDMVH